MTHPHRPEHKKVAMGAHRRLFSLIGLTLAALCGAASLARATPYIVIDAASGAVIAEQEAARMALEDLKTRSTPQW
jgi:D-alanyl-D-alanine carboxypeptidase